MKHSNDWENFEAPKAARREKKNRRRMPVHGRGLKKISLRPVLHIHKVSRRAAKK